MDINLSHASGTTITSLTDRICQANKVVADIYFNIDAKNRFYNLSQNELQKKAQYKKKSLFSSMILSAFIVWLPAAILSILLYSFLGEIGIEYKNDERILSVSWVFFFIIIEFFVFQILNNRRIKKQQKHQNLVNLYLSKAKEKENLAIEIAQINETTLEIIPPQYRYPSAMNYIEELFLNERATTVPEALDKFEEQLHRWRVEQGLSQTLEAISLQTKALKNIQDLLLWI